MRDTSHKPDEIYGLIERLAPGARKIGTGTHDTQQVQSKTISHTNEHVHSNNAQPYTHAHPQRDLWAAAQHAAWVGNAGQSA